MSTIRVVKKRIVILFLMIGGFLLWPQSISDNDDLLEIEDLDSLLENTFDEDISGDNQDVLIEKKKDDNISVIEQLLFTKALTITSNFKLTMGYAGGYSSIESIPESYSDGLGLDITGSLGLDFNLSREMRVYQKWNTSTPNPTLTCSTFYVDYFPTDVLSARAGIFNLTWGESENFSNTNIIARLPDNFSGSSKSLAFKINIPWEIGGLELLALTKQGFWENTSPSLKDYGFGVRLMTPFTTGDLTLSWYAHPDLNMRFSGSYKTTLFGKVEAYGEGLMAIDKDMVNGGDYTENLTEDGEEDDPVDYAINLGIYTKFFNDKLSVGGEYLYNGEESELNGSGVDYGTNLALGFKWTQGIWDFSFYRKSNETKDSGIFSTKLTCKPLKGNGVEFGAGYNFAWGSLFSTTKPIFFYMTINLDESWGTTL